MEKVIYNNKGGLGCILEGHEKEQDFFEKQSFVVNGQTIHPEDYTNLMGLFTSPVRFVGALKDKQNCMIFFLGTDGNLFENLNYYSCFFWIAENRLANKYTDSTARDFNFIGGVWK